MKEYWLSDNREMAERNALIMVQAFIEYRIECGKPPTSEEILQYIEDSIQKEEARLNKSFPNKAQ